MNLQAYYAWVERRDRDHRDHFARTRARSGNPPGPMFDAIASVLAVPAPRPAVALGQAVDCRDDNGGMMHDDEQYDDLDELPAPPRREMLASDRELLHMAGRALGAVRVEDVEGENWVNLHFADGSVAYAWNSLMHSDDMLNLAAMLHIDIAWLGDSDVLADGNSSEPTIADPAAAARRAVTRAAAEIHKARQ